MIAGTVTLLWFVGNETQKQSGLIFSQENNTQGIGGSAGSLPPATEEQNRTTEIAREIYTNYLARESGRDPSEISEVELTTLLDRPDINEASQVKTYTASDIHVVVETKESLEKYTKDLEAINEKYLFEGLGQEPNILNEIASLQASKKQKDEGVAKLQKSKESYNGMRDQLITTPVPSSRVVRHLELINTFEKFSVSTNLMQKAAYDPVYIIPSTKLFVEAVRTLFITSS